MRAFIHKHPVWWFYGFAFLISWTAWGLMALLNPTPPADMGQLVSSPAGLATFALSSLGGLGPLLSLWIIDRISARIPGAEFSLNRLLRTIRLRGANKGWLAVAVLALPVVTVLAEVTAAISRGLAPRLIASGPDQMGWMVLPVMVIQFAASLVTSPLFEEPGWRGFALPRLQARFGSLPGSLLVGTLWWLWHQPMNLSFGIQPSLHGFLSLVLFSFMIDSLFNLSGRNLLAALLAHGSSNTTMTFLYQRPGSWTGVLLMAALVLALRYVEWRGSRENVLKITGPVGQR